MTAGGVVLHPMENLGLGHLGPELKFLHPVRVDAHVGQFGREGADGGEEIGGQGENDDEHGQILLTLCDIIIANKIGIINIYI